MPALVRRHFPDRVGLLTAGYVTALVLGAALAARLDRAAGRSDRGG